MANATITVAGRLTADPELRFTSSGKAVCNFTVASNSRRKNEATGEWQDADSTFHRCSVWEEVAERVAECLTKGVEVIVLGDLVQREYETKEGEKRTVLEVKVRHVGAELTRFAGVAVKKLERAAAGANTWDRPAAPTLLDEPPF